MDRQDENIMPPALPNSSEGMHNQNLVEFL